MSSSAQTRVMKLNPAEEKHPKFKPPKIHSSYVNCCNKSMRAVREYGNMAGSLRNVFYYCTCHESVT